MRLLIQLLTGLENMQDVMAFPNTTSVESLMDSKNFSYDPWESELQTYVSLDDARELRCNSARLLSSSPFHPGLLYARAYAELIHPDGDLQDFEANFRSSLISAKPLKLSIPNIILIIKMTSSIFTILSSLTSPKMT